jgi:hypothetical protein
MATLKYIHVWSYLKCWGNDLDLARGTGKKDNHGGLWWPRTTVLPDFPELQGNETETDVHSGRFWA